MMYYGGDNGGNWAWMLLSITTTILFLGGFIWIARLVINGNRREERPVAPRAPDALDVLRHRYASGEVDLAEYEQRRQVLLGKP